VSRQLKTSTELSGQIATSYQLNNSKVEKFTNNDFRVRVRLGGELLHQCKLDLDQNWIFKCRLVRVRDLG